MPPPKPLVNPPAQPKHQNSARFYAVLAFACLLVSLLLIGLMIWRANSIAFGGLTGSVFYTLLIPLGLSNAIFLFGVMQSIAEWRGDKFGGHLVLGGPIIAVILTVWGGFYFAKPSGPDTFAVTVFVHGPAGNQDTILRGTGKVFMDLHGNRQSADVDNRGAAFFPGIPGDLRDQSVPVSVDSVGFENLDSAPKKLESDTLYLEVRKSAVHLHGIVTDDKIEPIPGATIDVEGIASGTTLANGRFEITIPTENVKPNLDLRVNAPGYVSQSHTVQPGSDQIELELEKQKP